MASNINPSYPPSGDAKTADVRSNFAVAKDEIEALQAGTARVSSTEITAGIGIEPRTWAPADVTAAIAAGSGGGGGIPEAPEDGKTYGRNNAAWSEVGTGGGGISDAPVDGSKYARQDAGWVSFTEFTEAPSGGAKYARQNAQWAAVSEFLEAPSDGSIYGRRDAGWVPVSASAAPIAFLDSGNTTASIYSVNDADGYISVARSYDLGGILQGGFTPSVTGTYHVAAAFNLDLQVARSSMAVEISLRNSGGSTKYILEYFPAPYNVRYMSAAISADVSLTAGTTYFWWLKRASGGADHVANVHVGTQLTRLT